MILASSCIATSLRNCHVRYHRIQILSSKHYYTAIQFKNKRCLTLSYPHLNKASIHNSSALFTSSSDTSVNENLSAKYEVPQYSKEILHSCNQLHASILLPLNEKLRGPLITSHGGNGNSGSANVTSMPFVLCVGNHSSGKSSFINHVVGRNVQTAGVAPTDDSFTVIAPGPEDKDQDGPALIGDPDMGFANLRQFGPTLIHHTCLKVRSNLVTDNFMLVDSPGMIDAPGSSGRGDDNSSMDRGYDFQGVVRWLATRADVVLLFFDPDKPGTTGETLSVLLHSLGGMDHKLLIVLNKADQFRKIHDFARAYGSLCWNLSKVIPRKDLPRIFTMCLPVKKNNILEDDDKTDASYSSGSSGLADLHHTRDEVVNEVMKAPLRRIDNVITGLGDSVHLLMMHATIMNHTRKLYSKALWNGRLQVSGTGVSGLSLTGLSLYAELPVQVSGSALGLTVAGTAMMQYLNLKNLKDMKEELSSDDGLTKAFKQTYTREIAEADEFIASIWQRVKESLKLGISAIGVENLPSVSPSEFDEMKTTLNERIPALRRKASASHYGNMK